MSQLTPSAVHEPTQLRACATLAILTWHEAVGERCLQLVTLLALAAAGLSLSLSEVAIFAHERVLVDCALTALTLAPLCISAALAQVLMGRDLGERTASALLSHPVPLWVWLLGRFLGLWFTQAALIGAMAAVFVPVLVGAGLSPVGTLGWAVGLTVVECTVALSVAMAARCVARPAMAAVMAVVILGAGYFTLSSSDLRDTPRAPVMPLYRVAQAVLPQMQRINLRPEAARGAPVPEHFVGYAVVYGLGYSTVALLVGAAAVSRRRRL